jgi:hypothetical protein
MGEKDIKVTMDAKMLQQVIKNLPGDLKNQVIFAPVMNVNVDQRGGNVSQSELYPNPLLGEKEIAFDFETFLEALDPPKLKSLIDMAVRVALKKNGTMRLAEGWLGEEGLLKHYHLEQHRKRPEGRIYNCDKETLEGVLNKHNWNKSRTGRELGIPNESIRRLIEYHQIRKEG